jgi:hypothetical protein
MSIIGSNVLAGASGQAGGGYEIERSVRLNAPDSAYLSRTPAVAGNRRTATFACWIKRAAVSGADQNIFSFGSTGGETNEFEIYFGSGGTNLVVRQKTTNPFNVVTTAVFRDPSAWYHVVVAIDTSQAIQANRVVFYINNTVATSSLASGTLSQNIDLGIGTALTAYIGRRADNIQYLGALLADVYYIDGQALDPTSFGEFDDNGVWQPIDASGLTFGTTGFHLPFSDNSTAAALGTDTSSNGNTWTVNNISVTAGAGNDSLVDSPTNGSQTDTGVGGEVVGNYCTWNPLKKVSGATAVNGNLAFTVPTDGGIASTFAISSGKWYWEVVLSSGRTILGLATTSWDPAVYPGYTAQGWGYSAFNGNKIHNASSTSYGASFTTGDVIGVAFDADAGTLTFYKNGASQGQAFSGITGAVYQPALGADGGTTGAGDANFGQRQWAYAAPAGFKALCTANLPEPTIADGSTAMDVALYTGNGSTQTISGLNFSPDFVWIKARNDVHNHRVFDTVRPLNGALYTNLTNAEVTSTVNDNFVSFNSDGFSLGATSGTNGSNQNGDSLVAWTWDAGSSTVTNTAGSITSQVRANASAGFSIATFTTNSSSGNATIGHGLGVAPKFVIVKSRNATYNWDIYHGGISNAKDGRLIFTTAAFTTSFVPFGGVDPTSTVFTLSQSFYGTGIDCVAYCFAPVAGYSSFGSYTGNGATGWPNADGPFVFLGFRPKFILLKCTSQAENWVIYDSVRETYNFVNDKLLPNSSAAESTNNNHEIDFLSNGFKIRNNNGEFNQNAATYIYYAVAENPFQYARAR